VIKAFLTLILCSIALQQTDAQTLEEGSWNDMHGILAGKSCQLTLYLFADSTIKGNYVFKSDTLKNLLAGRLAKGKVYLADIAHPHCVFSGTIVTKPAEEFTGTWADSLNKKQEAFGFLLDGINFGDYGNRYPGVSERDVEYFMWQVKHSILTRNRAWLAGHIQYPLHHVLKKGYPAVSSKQIFIKYFDQIFTPAFKARITSEYTTNLFTKNGDEMMGDGEIWIDGSVVIAINN
jgi:hypothetical protein